MLTVKQKMKARMKAINEEKIVETTEAELPEEALDELSNNKGGEE